jgi:hypothetical protein
MDRLKVAELTRLDREQHDTVLKLRKGLQDVHDSAIAILFDCRAAPRPFFDDLRSLIFSLENAIADLSTMQRSTSFDLFSQQLDVEVLPILRSHQLPEQLQSITDSPELLNYFTSFRGIDSDFRRRLEEFVEGRPLDRVDLSPFEVLSSTNLSDFGSKIDLFDDLQQLFGQIFRGEFEVPIPQILKDLLSSWMAVVNLVGISREIVTAIDEWDPQRVRNSRQLSANIRRSEAALEIAAEEFPSVGDVSNDLRAKLAKLRRLLPSWRPDQPPPSGSPGQRVVVSLFARFCDAIQQNGAVGEREINDALLGPVSDAVNNLLAEHRSGDDFERVFGEAEKLAESVRTVASLREELSSLHREKQRREKQLQATPPNLIDGIQKLAKMFGSRGGRSQNEIIGSQNGDLKATMAKLRAKCEQASHHGKRAARISAR